MIDPRVTGPIADKAKALGEKLDRLNERILAYERWLGEQGIPVRFWLENALPADPILGPTYLGLITLDHKVRVAIRQGDKATLLVNAGMHYRLAAVARFEELTQKAVEALDTRAQEIDAATETMEVMLDNLGVKVLWAKP